MGGTVAVTVREENGTEHRMSRWTNNLPYFVVNLKTFQKDPEHLQNYISMPRPDFINDNEGLAPVQYGLVVVDYMTDTILTMQGYSSLDSISGAGIRLAVDAKRYNRGNDDDDFARFKELLYNGRIKSIQTWNGVGLQDEDLSNAKPCQILEEFSDIRRNGFEMINVDTAPFKVEKFEESAQGALSMKGRLAELDFQYTKEEDKVWLDWVRGYEDEEYEDEE